MAFGLYLVVHSDEDGTNWDALMVAATSSDALRMWQEQMRDWWGGDMDDPDPTAIHHVLPGLHVPGPERRLEWGGPELVATFAPRKV